MEARAYLLHEDGAPCFDYFYKRNLVVDRPSDKVFHCVAISDEMFANLFICFIHVRSESASSPQNQDLARRVVSVRRQGSPLSRM